MEINSVKNLFACFIKDEFVILTKYVMQVKRNYIMTKNRNDYERTDEIIAKMKQSKHETLISRMRWDTVDLFLDVEIKNGASKREKKHITIREYRDFITSGTTQEDLRDQGVSKHILQFLSNFCQGKICLTQEQFEADYEDGLELEEIAKKHNVTRGDLGFLRQLYGIKRTGFEYQNRKRTELSMTDRQKEICYGSMMGDAKRQTSKFNTSMGFGHGDGQKDYLYWKFCELESISSKTSFKATEYVDKRSNFKGVSWRFYTNANSDIEEIIEEFYKNGTKEITQNILDHMSSLSIAVEFMDDGTTAFSYSKRDWGIHHTPMPSFCTECFSYESCLLMQTWFKDKWNISVRLRERQLKESVGYRIVVNNESVEDFFSLITPHIIPSMRYKIDYKEYARKRENNKA